MEFRTSTKTFEHWISAQTPIVRGDLRHKHLAMRACPFSFFRATYYRWAQQFFELEPATLKAPRVLATGDLHIENFGTWRDGLGRLAWGINDFDEAYPLPYTQDLVRLATSALLAIDQDHLNLRPKIACRSILRGYREGIKTGGRPFVIGEEHRWFKPILQNPLRDPGLFWDRLRALPRERMALPPQAKALLLEMLPDPKLDFKLHHRVAGLGNLGKLRFTAIADWHGGPVAREAKALTLSAAAWAAAKTDGPFYADILRGAVRSADPYLTVQGNWVTRRLSPDCRRLEVHALGKLKDEEWLLQAMGFETANVHLGTPGAGRAVAKHLAKYPDNALKKAAMAMKERVLEDFRQWR